MGGDLVLPAEAGTNARGGKILTMVCLTVEGWSLEALTPAWNSSAQTHSACSPQACEGTLSFAAVSSEPQSLLFGVHMKAVGQLWVLLLPLSTLSFETRSLTEPGAH